MIQVILRLLQWAIQLNGFNARVRPSVTRSRTQALVHAITHFLLFATNFHLLGITNTYNTTYPTQQDPKLFVHSTSSCCLDYNHAHTLSKSCCQEEPDQFALFRIPWRDSHHSISQNPVEQGPWTATKLHHLSCHLFRLQQRVPFEQQQ